MVAKVSVDDDENQPSRPTEAAAAGASGMEWNVYEYNLQLDMNKGAFTPHSSFPAIHLHGRRTLTSTFHPHQFATIYFCTVDGGAAGWPYSNNNGIPMISRILTVSH